MDNISLRIHQLTTKFQTNCPFEIANCLGIQIVHENLANILGYYSRHFRIKIIHINENVNELKQRFICAHELGHAVMHPESNTPFMKKNTLFSTERIEKEANQFAINLLFNPSFNSESITLQEAIEDYGIPKHYLQNNLLFF